MDGFYANSVQSPEPENYHVDPDVLAMFNRYEHIRQNDPKDALITELIIKLEQAKRERGQHPVENHDIVKALQREVKLLKADMARDPFALLLIDGDGMIFHEELLQAGEAGGKRAAVLLQTNALQHLQDTFDDLPHAIKVVCRVYANVRGLAEALYRARVIESPALFEAFVRGFTSSVSLFDFIDVAPGKDRADEKIGDIFRLHLRDPHCRHILLGVSHDNGFARLLEEPVLDPTVSKKIILVQGVPFEKELLALELPSVQFGNLYRDTKLVVPPTPLISRPETPQTGGTLTRSTTSSNSIHEATAVVAAKAAASNVSMTWAGLAAAPAPVPASMPPTAIRLKSPVSAPATPSSEITASLSDKLDDTIPRNRKGQRVDPPYRDYDKDEVERVKKLKLCNSHYLLNRCYREACGHRHDYKPKKTELDVLRLVARMAPCTAGAACDDASCIYGHRCPFPKRMDGKKIKKGEGEEGKTCMLGPQCRFGSDVHDLDLNVVRFTKVK